jgi:hypothetical protein
MEQSQESLSKMDPGSDFGHSVLRDKYNFTPINTIKSYFHKFSALPMLSRHQHGSSSTMTQVADKVQLIPSCAVGVYGDEDCEGEMIAYSMHWNGEPSCFNLTRSKGSYYASVSCIASTQPTSQTTTQTSDATIYISVGT